MKISAENIPELWEQTTSPEEKEWLEKWGQALQHLVAPSRNTRETDKHAVERQAHEELRPGLRGWVESGSFMSRRASRTGIGKLPARRAA